MAAFGILMFFIIVICILLILLILSQNPKGGGLSSTFGGGGTQMFGVQKTNDFMDKATWTLGGAIVVLSIFAGILIAKPSVISNTQQMQQQQQQTEKPQTPVKK